MITIPSRWRLAVAAGMLGIVLVLYLRSIAAPPAQAVDIRTTKADLVVPELRNESPAAGKRVRQVHPDYTKTKVYHVLYLPVDWKPGRMYPVIVEYAGNGPYRSPYGDVSTGLVEGSNLGYGISAGKEFIWLCLPYLNEKGTANVRQWWGDAPRRDPAATIAYCKRIVPWICQKYGGDEKRILLAGFSRGAIACNFIGLHDDEIAKLWRAFVPYSHYDGVYEKWNYPGADRKSARRRLQRLGNRPQFICHEENRNGVDLASTRNYLKSSKADGKFTFAETGFRNHNDAWTLRPGPVRKQLRQWVSDVLQ